MVVNDQKINLKSNQFLYYLEVSDDTEKLDISSVTNDKDTVVSVEGAEHLSYGENNVIIHLKAVDGTDVQYVLLVTRKKENNKNISLEKKVAPIRSNSMNIIDSFKIPILIIIIIIIFCILVLEKFIRKKMK